MPKVSRVGRSRNKLVVDSVKNEESNDVAKDPDSTQALSRGQRKRMQKRQQYVKREQMVLSTLKIQRLDDQKGHIDGMDAIKDALTETIKKNNGASKKSKAVSEPSSDNSNKAKKDIAQKELTHLNLVLQHPSFRENPFATMQEHLRNTLAEQAEAQEETAKNERRVEAKEVVKKKEARKERIRNAKFEKGRRRRRRR